MAVNEPNDPWAALNEGVQAKLDQAVGPAVAQAVTPAVNAAEARAKQYADGLVSTVKENQQPILDRLDALEGQVLTKAEASAEQVADDVVVRFHANPVWEVALGVLSFGVVAAGGLIVLIEYLNGNPRAADIKDAAGAVLIPIIYHLYLHFTAPKVPVSTVVEGDPVALAPAQAVGPTDAVLVGSLAQAAPALRAVTVTDTGTPPPLRPTS